MPLPQELIELVAEAIRTAISDINEGEPFTTKQWEWVAQKTLQALDDEGHLA